MSHYHNGEDVVVSIPGCDTVCLVVGYYSCGGTHLQVHTALQPRRPISTTQN
jgi:hypothetical protein